MCNHYKRANSLISIHAPREGRDVLDLRILKPRVDISIHAPREGRDFFITSQHCSLIRFQSTRPARGATKTFYDRYRR